MASLSHRLIGRVVASSVRRPLNGVAHSSGLCSGSSGLRIGVTKSNSPTSNLRYFSSLPLPQIDSNSWAAPRLEELGVTVPKGTI